MDTRILGIGFWDTMIQGSKYYDTWYRILGYKVVDTRILGGGY